MLLHSHLTLLALFKIFFLKLTLKEIASRMGRYFVARSGHSNTQRWHRKLFESTQKNDQRSESNAGSKNTRAQNEIIQGLAASN